MFSAPGHGNFRLFSSRNVKTETESSKREEELENSLEIDVSTYKYMLNCLSLSIVLVYKVTECRL